MCKKIIIRNTPPQEIDRWFTEKQFTQIALKRYYETRGKLNSPLSREKP